MVVVAKSEVAKSVANKVCEIWDNTEIPHRGRGNIKSVKERIEILFVKANEVLKVPVERRDSVEISQSWDVLFDISLCPHRAVKQCACPFCESPHLESCDCALDSKVPESWRDFLVNQRSDRTQTIGTVR